MAWGKPVLHIFHRCAYGLRSICAANPLNAGDFELLALRNSKHWNRQAPASSRHTRKCFCSLFDCNDDNIDDDDKGNSVVDKISICLSNVRILWHYMFVAFLLKFMPSHVCVWRLPVIRVFALSDNAISTQNGAVCLLVQWYHMMWERKSMELRLDECKSTFCIKIFGCIIGISQRCKCSALNLNVGNVLFGRWIYACGLGVTVWFGSVVGFSWRWIAQLTNCWTHAKTGGLLMFSLKNGNISYRRRGV